MLPAVLAVLVDDSRCRSCECRQFNLRGLLMHSCEAGGGGMRTCKNIKSGFRCLSCHSQGLFKNSSLVMGQMLRKTWPGTLQSRAAVWLFAGAG